MILRDLTEGRRSASEGVLEVRPNKAEDSAGQVLEQPAPESLRQTMGAARRTRTEDGVNGENE